jgi:hypothetical protein
MLCPYTESVLVLAVIARVLAEFIVIGLVVEDFVPGRVEVDSPTEEFGSLGSLRL